MDGTENRAVIAKYDFRSKQQYIYRTDKVREIVGGSSIITNMYELFLEKLIERGAVIEKNYTFDGEQYINDEKTPFTAGLNGMNGKVIYVGGGALYMLWRDRETCLEANRLLCRLLREHTYGLSPVCGIADYTGDYKKDHAAVEEDFNRVKALMPPFQPAAALPFTEQEPKTSLPIVYKEGGREPVSLSRESYLKRLRNNKVNERNGKNALLELDELTDKGDESLLAVIYADGNNMGKRVSAVMSPKNAPITDYPTAVRNIREFSNMIQRDYVSGPVQAVRDAVRAAAEEEAAKQNRPLDERKAQCRVIVAGGDEITVILKAKYALKAAKAYFTALEETNSGKTKPERNSACMGICVFHSHFPFASAYEIAEECCDNAKKLNRKNGGGHMLLDFQHCFGGISGNLDAMRDNDVKDKMMRPYLWLPEDKTAPDALPLLRDYERNAALASAIGRGNVKELAELHAEGSEKQYKLEVRRLQAQNEKAKDLDTKFDPAYLIDIAQFYDIWFRKEGEEA